MELGFFVLSRGQKICMDLLINKQLEPSISPLFALFVYLFFSVVDSFIGNLGQFIKTFASTN